MRVLPQRWWTVLFLTLFGAVIGAFLGARLNHEISMDIMPAAGIGALGMGLLAVGLLASFAPHDTRYLVLRDRSPEAIVIQALRDPDNTSALVELAAISSRSMLDLRWTFSIAFDRSGIVVWDGGSDPKKVGAIPWSAVSATELGDAYRPTTFGSQPYYRLLIAFDVGEGSVTLPFGVSRVPRFLSRRFTLDENELADLAIRLRALRDGREPSRARPVLSHTPAGLTPGPTAWKLNRLGPLPTLWWGWVSQAAFLTAVLSLVLRLPGWVTWSAVAVSIVILAVMLLRARQAATASKREAYAGYTTLNGVSLALEQRHPVSGRVIRAADDRALTKAEFAEALARG